MEMFITNVVGAILIAPTTLFASN